MKILVGIKRVVDYNVRIRVASDGSGVDTDGVKMSINPFDEIALEEALRIKERGEANEIVVVSIGSAESQQQLRTGLAMGADRAILVVAADDVHTDIEPLAVAKILAKVVAEENPGRPRKVHLDCRNDAGRLLLLQGAAGLIDLAEAVYQQIAI